MSPQKFGGTGSGQHSGNPVVGKDGNIYISSWSTRTIYVYSPSGQLLKTMVLPASAGDRVYGIGYDPVTGLLHVSTGFNTLAYDADFNLVSTWNIGKESRGLVFVGDKIYSPDYYNSGGSYVNTVSVYDRTTHQLIETINTGTSGASTGFAIDNNGYRYYTNAHSETITVKNAEGTTVATISTGEGYLEGYATGISIMPDGRIVYLNELGQFRFLNPVF